jgi:hypothetical protein
MRKTQRNGQSLIARFRRAGRRGAIGVMSLFVTVWLNMAMQPCLMAAEPLLPEQHQDGGCPHCPPAIDSHCGEVEQGRCAFLDGFDFDGRQPADGSASLDLAHACAGAGFTVDFVPAVASPAYARDDGPPPTGPPLFVRNCSFLN